MNDEELKAARSALAERVTNCWDRLDDAVSELVALHEVPAEEIVARVRRAIESELPAAALSSAL